MIKFIKRLFRICNHEWELFSEFKPKIYPELSEKVFWCEKCMTFKTITARK